MSKKLGVKFSPHLLAELMRIGARITGKHGFAAQLIDQGIPENYQMINSGMDGETGEFFLVFSEHGKKVQGPVQWQAPVYEKEKEASDGSTA